MPSLPVVGSAWTGSSSLINTEPNGAVLIRLLKVFWATPNLSAAARWLIFSALIAAIAILILDSGVAACTASVTTGHATAQWWSMVRRAPLSVKKRGDE